MAKYARVTPFARIAEIGERTDNLRVSDVELICLQKAVDLLWLNLADHDPAEFTNLYPIPGELEMIAHEWIPGGETLSPIAFHRARETLKRCLSSSKEFSEDIHLWGLMKSDAMESMARLLKGLF
jgi:hypothetical protein